MLRHDECMRSHVKYLGLAGKVLVLFRVVNMHPAPVLGKQDAPFWGSCQVRLETSVFFRSSSIPKIQIQESETLDLVLQRMVKESSKAFA